MRTKAPTLTTINITGGGDEWTNADRALDRALDQANATIDVYDQEPDGIIITRYRVRVMTAKLRRLVEAAPHANYEA